MIRADESTIRRLAEVSGRPLTDAMLAALRVDTRAGDPTPSVLAVCPNSEAVAKASMLGARDAQAPLFFAATLNQVDLDGGYTGWTQHDFVRLARQLALEYEYEGPIVVGLDHGGPWLKDVQTKEEWSLTRAMEESRSPWRGASTPATTCSMWTRPWIGRFRRANRCPSKSSSRGPLN